MSAVLEAVRPIEDYLVMPDAEIAESIEEARRELGEKVIILGHHYQREDVIAHADLTGDSYQIVGHGFADGRGFYRFLRRAFYGGIG